MTIGGRIKAIREKLGITQAIFAEKLGTARNTIANYEIGRREPMDATIKAICREFNVNETWLRTGEGNMFIALSKEDKIGIFFQGVMADDSEAFRKRFVSALARLTPELWEQLEHVIKCMLIEYKNPPSFSNNKETEKTKLAPPVPNVTQYVMSKLAEMEQQNKKLLARLDVLEKEEDEKERMHTKQSVFPARSHTQ